MLNECNLDLLCSFYCTLFSAPFVFWWREMREKMAKRGRSLGSRNDQTYEQMSDRHLLGAKSAWLFFCCSAQTTTIRIEGPHSSHIKNGPVKKSAWWGWKFVSENRDLHKCYPLLVDHVILKPTQCIYLIANVPNPDFMNRSANSTNICQI